MLWIIALSPVVKSLILPGWGQMDFDRRTGFAMIAVEIAGWGYYFLLDRQQDDAISTYRRIAYDYSGATSFSDRRIFSLLEDYYEKDFYVMDLYAEARARYPDDPHAQDEYVRLNLIDADWKWQSVDKFFQYQDYRMLDRALGSRKVIVGFVLFANHVVSALHAYLFGADSGYEMGFYPLKRGVGFAVKKEF